MIEAVLMWIVFTILICSLIGNFIDSRELEKKDDKITVLENENEGLKQMVFEYQTKLKFTEHSKFFEEL